MTIQMMMAAEDNGALVDGWHLLARLHIPEREYQKATRNDTDWAARRTGLGMGSYERNDARDMSNEDWLLVVVSHATGLDMRGYCDPVDCSKLLPGISHSRDKWSVTTDDNAGSRAVSLTP